MFNNVHPLPSPSPGHDLPPIHLVCVRLESPQSLTLCLSELRHLLPSIPLRPLFIRYNKKKILIHTGSWVSMDTGSYVFPTAKTHHVSDSVRHVH
jgi:hypothetical protein